MLFYEQNSNYLGTSVKCVRKLNHVVGFIICTTFQPASCTLTKL